jgi:two-component system, chemotaxis family, protein-glutamate methylesterase/glutaminase
MNAPLLIAIGASTGGTEALRVILDDLPPDLPPIVITQRMPEAFTSTFAKRLNSTSRLSISEAAQDQIAAPGEAVVARGDRHLVVLRSGSKYRLDLCDGACVARHRPSVDVLFRSVAIAAGPSALGVILTGMGDDGASCLREMKDTGATTFAQDEASSVVFGMPQMACKNGAVSKVVALSDMAREICHWAGPTR